MHKIFNRINDFIYDKLSDDSIEVLKKVSVYFAVSISLIFLFIFLYLFCEMLIIIEKSSLL